MVTGTKKEFFAGSRVVVLHDYIQGNTTELS